MNNLFGYLLYLLVFVVSVFTLARDTRNLEINKTHRWIWLFLLLFGALFFDFLGIATVLVIYGVWRLLRFS